MAEDEKFEDAVDWEFKDKEVKMLDKITHLHQQITDLKKHEWERESIGREILLARGTGETWVGESSTKRRKEKARDRVATEEKRRIAWEKYEFEQEKRRNEQENEYEKWQLSMEKRKIDEDYEQVYSS